MKKLLPLHMAAFLVKANDKAQSDVCSHLSHLSSEEKAVIRSVLERDRKLQNEISDTFQLSPDKSFNEERDLTLDFTSKYE